MGQITGKLEKWVVDDRFGETEEYIIWGTLLEDKESRWKDGTRVHTSGINEERFPKASLEKGSIIKTRNSTYELGEPLNASLSKTV